MGKRKVIAETGAGQHGVATAAAAALLGLECRVFMGAADAARQAPNVRRMRLLGAEVVPVDGGTATLKDAMNEALRYWVGAVRDTFYVIGSVAGPHPYPLMVREFQRVIGDEAREQSLTACGRLPDALVACVGGGSNAMGLFHAFRDDPVEMVGVEAAGEGIDTGPPRRHPGAGPGGRAARRQVVRPAGRRRPGAGGPLRLGRPGLSRRRAGARLAEGPGPRAVRVGHRRGGPGRLPDAVPDGGHPAGPGELPRPGLGDGRSGRRPAADILLVNLSGRGDKDLGIVGVEGEF